jgi:preprotein translocase subunit SecE
MRVKGRDVAQAKNPQPNPTRAGMNREQSRRMAAMQGRSPSTPTAAGGRTPPGGRRPPTGGSVLTFVRDVRSELRKVSWPTPREAADLTMVVLALSIAVGAFLGGVDFIFQELFRWILGLSGTA